MSKIILKNWMAIAAILAIIVLYFLLRLPNLNLQPIFADEAIYIRWAQVMKAEPTLRFLPLSDGKTPLFMWTMIPLFKVFADPLFAGRFLSVLSGFMTLIGAFVLGWRFFSRKAGLWSALLIAIVPYMVFFDRMALVDSMLAAFSIWALIFSLLLVQYQRLDLAMFLGYILGGGLLTKTPGFFSILMLPASILASERLAGNRQQKLLKILGLWVLALLITFAIYSVLKLGPGFSSLSTRNQDYIFSPLDLLERPWDPFLPHFKDLTDWLPKMLTVPVLLLTFFGAIWAVISKNRYALVVLIWSIVPILIQTALLKTFTARYLLFSIPPLLCLAGWALSKFSERVGLKTFLTTSSALIILLPWPLYFNFRLLSDPASAPLPKEERHGYLEDWTAGYGFPEIAQFLMDKSRQELVVVGTEGYFGTLPDGLQIYLDKHSHSVPPDRQVVVIGGQATVSAQVKNASLEHPTFFVTNKSRYIYPDPDLRFIKEYPKAKGSDPQDAIMLFEVVPAESK